MGLNYMKNLTNIRFRSYREALSFIALNELESTVDIQLVPWLIGGDPTYILVDYDESTGTEGRAAVEQTT